ncbi:MFS transporter [Sinanaerobacter chloroacetimidivorans]|uniref:MFS transporter n=1 Tax=Sinanaerobacter chloroacetimidivorans TaxID=2818044 RepID=A0A8J7W561_9FIRM|nr:MFS transporter [Sinanaerobacter chloroacetimidivorans]MBR0599150.1 MFS transporter [Sinanaerobacter chloroacetimidivorans]
MESKKRKYLSILALSAAGGSIYLIPYIRYVFYDHQIAAMGITNQQLGLLTSIYAIGCMILYIPGGIIADKTSTKKCILISLASTTLLTVIYAFTLGYTASLAIWFLFAFTTTFVFWGSLFKTIRLIGTAEEQGFMFGLYYMGNGITGAIVNSIAIWATGFSEDMKSQFFNAVLIYAASTAVAAVLIWFLVKEDKERSKELKVNEFKLSQVGELIKNPTVWIFSIIIFAGYSIYSSTSYFTPYLTEVVGITPEESGVLSIFRTYLFYILAPVSGILADKVFKSTSKWFMFLFIILAALFAGVLMIPEGTGVVFVSIYTLLPGMFGLALYGVVFSIANETRIPAAVMGTAVGIASIIGYTPDFFMATMFGTWLDNHGAGGYNYIFIFLAFVCLVGCVASFFVRRRAKLVQDAEAAE